MARKYSSEYKNLQPYVVADIRKVVAGASMNGGGGGTTGVTDHGALTGLADDDHPQYLTPVRGDARYITSLRQVIAGNGLTGGGALSADVTLNVGVSGLGLGVGADAVTLTSSTDVGTTPAAAILASTAGGALRVSSLGIGTSAEGDGPSSGDLVVGANLLYADYSKQSVGILCQPDAQFALDVNGPARATYFVGPHAIQLKNVVLLSHFDGRLPYSTNYYGEPNGHMGQVATVAGGITYRPGKFYKAVQIAEAGYNYCPNPSAETNATGWTQQYNGGTLTSQVRIANIDAPYGSYDVSMSASTSSSYTFNAPHFHAPDSVTMTWNNGQTATLSCYVWGTGTWRIVFEDSGQNLRAYQEVTLSPTAEWQRIVLTVTNSSGNNYANVRLAFFPRSTTCNIHVDGVHYEANNRATPYLDGSMGDSPGHSWNGTAHASYSVRNAASLSYTQPMPTNWTIMFWAYRASWQAGALCYQLGWGGTNTSVYYNASNQDVIAGFNAGTPTDGWHHYCITYDTAGIVRAYRDGAYVNQHSNAITTATAIYVGWNGAGAQSNSLIDDLCLLERAMAVNADNSCNELRSVYESNAPVFAETSTFSFRPTPKGLIWADDEGLWMRATDGDTVLGVYGNDAATKLWGGQTMSAGDLLIGNATNYMFWDDSAATLTIAGNGSGMTSINGGNIQTGTITGNKISLTTTIGINSTTFGNAGIQLDYNAGSPRFYAGNGSTSFLQYNGTNVSMTGFITATGGSFTGAVYCGSNAVRFSTDGQRLVLADTTSPNVVTSSSAFRWFAGIDETWADTNNYAGIIGYRHTSYSAVDMMITSYVGSTNAASYDARVVIQAGHNRGGVYEDANLIIARNRSTTGSGITATCDTFTASNNVYVTNNMSALSITDRTPAYEGNALQDLRQVRGKSGKIDHGTLPAFARKQVRRPDGSTEEGRDIGAMISVLTKAVQELDARLDAIGA